MRTGSKFLIKIPQKSPRRVISRYFRLDLVDLDPRPLRPRFLSPLSYPLYRVSPEIQRAVVLSKNSSLVASHFVLSGDRQDKNCWKKWTTKTRPEKRRVQLFASKWSTRDFNATRGHFCWRFQLEYLHFWVLQGSERSTLYRPKTATSTFQSNILVHL